MKKFVHLHVGKSNDNVHSVSRSNLLSAHLSGLAALKTVNSDSQSVRLAPNQTPATAELIKILKAIVD